MYFGSVRFFKHIIIGAIALMIAVPTGLSISFSFKVNDLSKENDSLQHQLDQMLTEEASGQKAEKPSAEPSGNFNAESEGQTVWTENLPYQEMYPELYSEPPKTTVYKERVAYLTFDDGPSDLTEQVLNILAQHDIKATFFVTGHADSEKNRALMRRIVAEGHTLGIHTYSHDFKKIYADVNSYLDDFSKIYQLIYDTTGVKASVFRFAGGSVNSYNQDHCREIITEMTRRGFTYYDWNVAAMDAVAGGITVKQAADNVLNKTAQVVRAIVLLHDSQSKETTVKALDQIIAGLEEQGFSFDKITNEVQPVTFAYWD